MNYVYFWGHTKNNQAPLGNECLSQWYHAPFKEYNDIIKKVVTYATCEHYMMYHKALLFGDTETAELVLKAPTPKEAKALGRKVRNFDEVIWKENREKIVTLGNYIKFMENEDLREYLLRFPDDTVFVEASPYDTIWGVGLSASDPKIKDPKQWRGLNLLGDALTRTLKGIKKWQADKKQLDKDELQLNRFVYSDEAWEALDIAYEYAGIDGDHHKAWVIDQMVRALTGDRYEAFVKEYESPLENGDHYTWNTGIAP